MANTDLVKNQIMSLVAEGNADAAWEYAEAIRDQLTPAELKDLEYWIAKNAYQSARPSEEAVAGVGKWLQVAEYMNEGETLRDVYPRLPSELQEFLEREAKLAKTPKLH